ncbi:DUF6913 domain-containing protein [Flavobacterium ponti]|jgi:hypothetical protein|uniref:DUF6913 domain-containing protein n=1 Tax=Flavobacterium ponti TaxID=665133 RepID=A0ABV9P2J9_9FLAO
MFYRTIKDFLVKKHIKKSLAKGLSAVNSEPIKTIGVLIDGIHFSDKDKLINEFKKHSNGQFKVNLLIFRKKVNKKESIEYPYFTKKDIGFSGNYSKGEIENFVNFPFDLLINFYDESNANLELITAQSKAKFKVGFASVNKDLNHFFVNTFVEKYVDFTQVLFDYLRILKKV